MASNIVHYNHWASKQSTPSTFEHWNDYKQASNPDSLIAKLWKSWRCTLEDAPLKLKLNKSWMSPEKIDTFKVGGWIDIWKLLQVNCKCSAKTFWLPAISTATSSSICWLRHSLQSWWLQALGVCNWVPTGSALAGRSLPTTHHLFNHLHLRCTNHWKQSKLDSWNTWKLSPMRLT